MGYRTLHNKIRKELCFTTCRWKYIREKKGLGFKVNKSAQRFFLCTSFVAFGSCKAYLSREVLISGRLGLVEMYIEIEKNRDKHNTIPYHVR